ncbi:MAG TPA: hypothetical protein V6C65_32855, partial [Allocoleopsis sp.]
MTSFSTHSIHQPANDSANGDLQAQNGDLANHSESNPESNSESNSENILNQEIFSTSPPLLDPAFPSNTAENRSGTLPDNTIGTNLLQEFTPIAPVSPMNSMNATPLTA